MPTPTPADPARAPAESDSCRRFGPASGQPLGPADTWDGLLGRLAVARLDGDLYESTMDALVSLYPRLSPSGFLVVDDYGAVAACRQAVHDYRDRQGITEEIRPVDWSAVYWNKSP